jgi:hypothetical protein
MMDAIFNAVCPPGSVGGVSPGTDAIFNVACPPGSVADGLAKRKNVDPEQNAQYWNYSDYSSQGSDPSHFVQCSQAKCSQPREGDESVPASPTPERSMGPSRVSVTPGMAVPDSVSQPRVFGPSRGTGSNGVFMRFQQYEGFYRRAMQLEECFDRELGPRLFQLQLETEEAVERLKELEKQLGSESLEKLQRIYDEWATRQDMPEEQKVQWLHRHKQEAKAVKDLFYEELEKLQTEFNRKLENFSPEFNQIKGQIAVLQRDWELMHTSMDELYRSVAAEEALEARLMTRHLSLRMPQVGICFAVFYDLNSLFNPPRDGVDLAVVPCALFHNADFV